MSDDRSVFLYYTIFSERRQCSVNTSTFKFNKMNSIGVIIKIPTYENLLVNDCYMSPNRARLEILEACCNAQDKMNYLCSVKCQLNYDNQ